MLFKALKYITCQGKEYAPGEIIPGAASFINLKEMIQYDFIGYATEQEIADYEAKQKQTMQTDMEDAKSTKNKKSSD
jgi:hypothetical protein